MIVREFNDEGMRRFREFLVAARENPKMAVPLDMLEDDAVARVVHPNMQVEVRKLIRKADAANYLDRVLKPLAEKEVAENAGLWTWLSLFYFDEVCPPTAGKRMVKNDYHYVFEPKNARHFYRHLLFVAWRVLRVAGDHNRLFLGSPVATLDKVTTEVMKRLFLTRIPCIFEVLDRLYWDDNRSKARAGIVGTRPIRPGDLTHRLPLRVRQLEKTFDLVSLNAEQLIKLLGPEFQPPESGAAGQQILPYAATES